MEALKYVATYLIIIVVCWIGGVYFADNVSTHEVIEVNDKVDCIIVSRMFNTSVDCWKK